MNTSSVRMFSALGVTAALILAAGGAAGAAGIPTRAIAATGSVETAFGSSGGVSGSPGHGSADEATGDSARQIVLEGAINVRELGGYATQDGRSVAWGKAFRAGDLSGLTPADVEKLQAAGIATVVDFRGADEIAKDGSAPVPETIELVNIPVLDETTQALAEALTGVLRGGDPAVVEEMLGDGESQRIKDESFVAQLDQPATMAAYARTLELIAERPGALVFHCTAGKDRTGMMSAILLGLLGVPDHTIVDDFVLSNEYLAEHYAGTYAFLESKGVDVELIRPLTEQSPSNIQPVLDAVHNQYGGWDAFATDVMGLDADTLDALRVKLLA